MSDLKKIDDLDPKLFNPMKEKQWQFEKRMEQHQFNKGSRYPPFAIEPMPFERQRLAKPMTDAERFLRKQWVKDQVLSPSEPRYVPALYPRNIFRRVYNWPLDQVFKPLIPLVGMDAALVARALTGRFIIFGSIIFFWIYHLKFEHQDWFKPSGWYSYGNRPRYFFDSDHRFAEVTRFAHAESFAQRDVLLDSSKNSGPQSS